MDAEDEPMDWAEAHWQKFLLKAAPVTERLPRSGRVIS
jgi:hypothetical protein